MTVTYRLTEKEYLAGYKSLIRLRRQVVSVTVGALIAVGLLCFASMGRDRVPEAAVLGIAFVAVLPPYLVIQSTRAGRKLYREIPPHCWEVKLEFDGEMAHWTNARGETHLRWSEFIKFSQSANFVFVFSSSAYPHIIPKRALQDPGVLEQFLGYLRAANVPEKRL